MSGKVLRHHLLKHEWITHSLWFMVINKFFFGIIAMMHRWFITHCHFLVRSLSFFGSLMLLNFFVFLRLKEKLRKLLFKLLDLIDILFTWFTRACFHLKPSYQLSLPIFLSLPFNWLFMILLCLLWDFTNEFLHFTFILFRTHRFC